MLRATVEQTGQSLTFAGTFFELNIRNRLSETDHVDTKTASDASFVHHVR